MSICGLTHTHVRVCFMHETAMCTMSMSSWSREWFPQAGGPLERKCHWLTWLLTLLHHMVSRYNIIACSSFSNGPKPSDLCLNKFMNYTQVIPSPSHKCVWPQDMSPLTMALAHLALRAQLPPLLGLCLGHQALGVAEAPPAPGAGSERGTHGMTHGSHGWVIHRRLTRRYCRG